MAIRDITGEKFNKLTAIRFDKIERIPGEKKANYHFWIFKCECGVEKSIRKSNVIKKGATTTSCGCVNTATRKVEAKKRKVWEFANKANTKHGLSSSRFGKIFNSLKQRCNNPKNPKYSIYGNAGIKCDWHNLLDFKTDMYSSYLNHVGTFGERNTTIDRIDSNGDYSKKNCRWATYKEQNNNLKQNVFFTYNGETLCKNDWAKRIGITCPALHYRLKKYNNDIKLAIENPTPYTFR